MQYISFNHEQSVISIDNAAVTQVMVTIKYENYEDVCMVYLKQYPDSIYFDNSIVNLQAGGIAQLSYSGNFSSQSKPIDVSFYHTKIQSSDESVIEVLDSDNLIIKSTGRSGSSTLTVSMVNTEGKVVSNLTTSIVVNVVNSVKNCTLNINNNIIRNISLQESPIASQVEINGFKLNDELEIGAIFTDKYDFILNQADFIITSENQNIAVVNGKTITLKASGEVELLITPNIYDVNGNPVVFKLIMQINLSS